MLTNTIKMPLSFDYEFYKKDKPNLQSREEAYEHFVTVGRREGLKGSPACDQGYLLKYIRDLHPEKILEIGPGCTPKLNGSNVYYFDVKSREELQERYRNDPGFEKIPGEIHYVDKTGDIRNIDDLFDIVFSSHAIEHAFDLINHLNDVDSILDNNGLYVVVAPNKKFTFDYFKPVSVVEDVLAEHCRGANDSSLSLRAVLLETYRRTHNSPARHWADDHGEVILDSSTKSSMLNTIDRFDDISRNSVALSGYHKWIFTEESFVELVNTLYDLGLISLRIYESYNTPFGGMSFSAVLGR